MKTFQRLKNLSFLIVTPCDPAITPDPGTNIDPVTGKTGDGTTDSGTTASTLPMGAADDAQLQFFIAHWLMPNITTLGTVYQTLATHPLYNNIVNAWPNGNYQFQIFTTSSIDIDVDPLPPEPGNDHTQIVREKFYSSPTIQNYCNPEIMNLCWDTKNLCP